MQLHEACLHVCVCVCMYACIINACLYVCMFVCMCECVCGTLHVGDVVGVCPSTTVYNVVLW